MSSSSPPSLAKVGYVARIDGHLPGGSMVMVMAMLVVNCFSPKHQLTVIDWAGYIVPFPSVHALRRPEE